MFKFTAEYEDWNGTPKKKELLFNLTKTEIIKLQNTKQGGLEGYYTRILDENDNVELYKRFEELVQITYGVRSDDGERFIKNDEVFNAFKESVAYDVFMQYLLTTPNGASEFIKGILPKDIVAKLNTPEGKKLAEEHGIDVTALS